MELGSASAKSLCTLSSPPSKVISLMMSGVVTTPRRQRPLAERESARWLDTAARAKPVLQTAAMVTVVDDREGDIYEAFALRPQGVDLLIRAAQDRALEDEGRLFESLDALPVAARACGDAAPASALTSFARAPDLKALILSAKE